MGNNNNYSNAINNRLLEPLVDGALVKGVYVVKLEEGLISWWPPKLDNEIKTLIANISVPMINGLYFVVGNGFFPEIQVCGRHNFENNTTVHNREESQRGSHRREAWQNHSKDNNEEAIEKPLLRALYLASSSYTSRPYINPAFPGTYTASLMRIMPR